MRKITTLFLLLVSFSYIARSDEGMWIPMLLEKYTITEMQEKGFKLTAEDIYSINQASLKDAVIGLGREGSPFMHFCTGEIISNEGLVLTNHHCVYSLIQSHTSLQNNYLRDGFWARNREEELTNPGITASILVRMEDVTEKVEAVLNGSMTEKEREEAIKEVSNNLISEIEEGTNLRASIKPYFNGNQFFMSVFKIFKDVRLVGAPPSAIGKFGGDTDNWTWPRHTGDFSLLRIYAGTDNEPASYTAENIPYQPNSFFKISTQGVKEGDFTMVFGYPASTNEYLTSFAIDQITELENPHKINIRTLKLGIIDKAMESDELLRIKYAAKAASVANAWKKWQGEIKGLKRFETAQNKRIIESQFNEWAKNNPSFEGVVQTYKELYTQREKYILASVYANEAGLRGNDILNTAWSLATKVEKYEQNEDKEALKNSLLNTVRSFYKDFDLETDKEIMNTLLDLYKNNLESEWVPIAVQEVNVDYVFENTLFADTLKLVSFIKELNADSYSELQNDPLVYLAASINEFNRNNITPYLQEINNELKHLDRLWMSGLMKMNPDKNYYSDANSTLRVAYGQVGGYYPVDAVYYGPVTTLEGIMEKNNPNIYDYNVPQRLKDLYYAKDYGKYAVGNEMPVCFAANNHTTGGNSGSPVLNADGHLIGINFDRAWEGVMSDMQYIPEICRNISVDVRYILFIIDKFAGATHLLDEMVFVNENTLPVEEKTSKRKRKTKG